MLGCIHLFAVMPATGKKKLLRSGYYLREFSEPRRDFLDLPVLLFERGVRIALTDEVN